MATLLEGTPLANHGSYGDDRVCQRGRGDDAAHDRMGDPGLDLTERIQACRNTIGYRDWRRTEVDHVNLCVLPFVRQALVAIAGDPGDHEPLIDGLADVLAAARHETEVVRYSGAVGQEGTERQWRRELALLRALANRALDPHDAQRFAAAVATIDPELPDDPHGEADLALGYAGTTVDEIAERARRRLDVAAEAPPASHERALACVAAARDVLEGAEALDWPGFDDATAEAGVDTVVALVAEAADLARGDGIFVVDAWIAGSFHRQQPEQLAGAGLERWQSAVAGLQRQVAEGRSGDDDTLAALWYTVGGHGLELPFDDGPARALAHVCWREEQMGLDRQPVAFALADWEVPPSGAIVATHMRRLAAVATDPPATADLPPGHRRFIKSLGAVLAHHGPLDVADLWMLALAHDDHDAAAEVLSLAQRPAWAATALVWAAHSLDSVPRIAAAGELDVATMTSIVDGDDPEMYDRPTGPDRAALLSGLAANPDLPADLQRRLAEPFDWRWGVDLATNPSLDPDAGLLLVSGALADLFVVTVLSLVAHHPRLPTDVRQTAAGALAGVVAGSEHHAGILAAHRAEPLAPGALGTVLEPPDAFYDPALRRRGFSFEQWRRSACRLPDPGHQVRFTDADH